MVFVVLNPTKIVTLQVDALILVSDGVNLNLSVPFIRSQFAQFPHEKVITFFYRCTYRSYVGTNRFFTDLF